MNNLPLSIRSVRSLAALVPLLGICSVVFSSEDNLGSYLAAEQTIGALLSANNEYGDQLSIKVLDVEPDPHDQAGELSLYTIAVKSDHNGDWQNMCTEDANGDAKAIPLSGYWDVQGRHVPSDTVTFACTSGVLAKCARWGYKPWNDQSGVSGRDLHQACVRMARADYCGNGTSHTRNGTPINIYDRLGIQQSDPLETMEFEAAWGPDGAVALSRTRWPDTLKILAAECPDKLDDIYSPGSNSPGSNSSGLKVNLSARALIFNDSIPRR